MAGELVAQLGCTDLVKEYEMGELLTGSLGFLPVGKARGLRFGKVTTGNNVKLGYWGLVTVPTNLTITTGLTWVMPVTDDGSFPGDLGSVAVFGITVKKVSSGASADIDASAGTEVTGNVTLSATSGNIVVFSIAVANANLNSAGAGDQILFRVRRVGTSASDVVTGSILMLPPHIKNT